MALLARLTKLAVTCGQANTIFDACVVLTLFWCVVMPMLTSLFGLYPL